MSANLSSTDTLSALTTYWVEKHRDDPGALERALYLHFRDHSNLNWKERHENARDFATKVKDRHGLGLAVYLFLLEENIQSLSARYKEDATIEKWAADPASYTYKPSNAVKEWIRTKQTGRLVGLANGYEYQSCEHDAWRGSIGFYLIDQIKGKLLRDFEIEADGGWSCFQEPETEGPVPVNLSDLIAAH